MAEQTERYKSFKEFWPFYMGEHSNPTCKRLHVIGTGLVHIVIFLAIYKGDASILWFGPLIGYGFAWVGHFFFEKNRPATFKYPLYSLIGDFKLFYVEIGRLFLPKKETVQ